MPRQDSLTIHLSVPQLPEGMGQAESNQSLPTLTLNIVNGVPMLQPGQRTASVAPGKPRSAGKHVCQHCGRDCLKPSVLEKHLRCHTGERPYPCATCGIAFKTQSNLYKHKRTQAHARLSSESERSVSISNQETSQGSTDTCHSLESMERTQSGDLGSFEKETAAAAPAVTPPVEPCAPTTDLALAAQGRTVPDTGWALHQAALVILAPVNGNQENLSSLAQRTKQPSGPDSRQNSEDGERPSPPTPNRHLPLQRQEATYFSKQWDSRVSSGKSQSHDSTDSGYLSLSESGEQQSWVSSPNSSLREPSMESLLETTMEYQGEATAPPTANCTAETDTTHSGTKPRTSVLEKKTLEERISKLISDNDALVDDKCLENVRPRKTVLSKQGSIDLPMPYTYKDSFHFEIKASKKTSIGANWPKPDSSPKPAPYNSVPTQRSTSLERIPVTRSSSMPFIASSSGLERNTTQCFYHRETAFIGGRDSSGHLYTGDFAARSVDLQSTHHRSLVRQVAVDCLPTSESHSTSVEEGCQSSLSSEGDSIDSVGESSGGKCRRKKAPKFSYNKWYMYGDGTFRKLYQMEKGSDQNAKLAGGIGKGRKTPVSMEPGSISEDQSSSMATPATPVLRVHNISETSTDLNAPARADKIDIIPSSCTPTSGVVTSTKQSSSLDSSPLFQKPILKGTSGSMHQCLVRQKSIVGSDCTHISGAWSTKEVHAFKTIEQDKGIASQMCLGHLPSERKKQKTDERLCGSSSLAEGKEHGEKAQNVFSQTCVISTPENSNHQPNQIRAVYSAKKDTTSVERSSNENPQDHRMNLNFRFINRHFNQAPVQIQETSSSQSIDIDSGTSASPGKGNSASRSFLPKYQLKLPCSASQGSPTFSQATSQRLPAVKTTACLNSELFRRDTSSYAQNAKSEEDQSLLNNPLTTCTAKQPMSNLHCEVIKAKVTESKMDTGNVKMKAPLIAEHLTNASDASKCITSTGTTSKECALQDGLLQKEAAEVINDTELVEHVQEGNGVEIIQKDIHIEQCLSSSDTISQRLSGPSRHSDCQTSSSKTDQTECKSTGESPPDRVSIQYKSIPRSSQILPNVPAQTGSSTHFPAHHSWFYPAQGVSQKEYILDKSINFKSNCELVKSPVQKVMPPEYNLSEHSAGHSEQRVLQSEHLSQSKGQNESIHSSTENNAKDRISQGTSVFDKDIQPPTKRAGDTGTTSEETTFQPHAPASPRCDTQQVRGIPPKSMDTAQCLSLETTSSITTALVIYAEVEKADRQPEATDKTMQELPSWNIQREAMKNNNVRACCETPIPCPDRPDMCRTSSEREVVTEQNHKQCSREISLIKPQPSMKNKTQTQHEEGHEYCRHEIPIQEETASQHFSHLQGIYESQNIISTSNQVHHQSEGLFTGSSSPWKAVQVLGKTAETQGGSSETLLALRRLPMPSATTRESNHALPEASDGLQYTLCQEPSGSAPLYQIPTFEDMSLLQGKILEPPLSLCINSPDTGTSAHKITTQNQPSAQMAPDSRKSDLSSQKLLQISPSSTSQGSASGDLESVPRRLKDKINLNNKKEVKQDDNVTFAIHTLPQASNNEQTKQVIGKLPGQEKSHLAASSSPSSAAHPAEINSASIALDASGQYKLLNQRVPCNVGRLETNHGNQYYKCANHNKVGKELSQMLSPACTAQRYKLTETNPSIVPHSISVFPSYKCHSSPATMDRGLVHHILTGDSDNISSIPSQPPPSRPSSAQQEGVQAGIHLKRSGDQKAMGPAAKPTFSCCKSEDKSEERRQLCGSKSVQEVQQNHTAGMMPQQSNIAVIIPGTSQYQATVEFCGLQ
ncbi:ZN831 protein, partial [Amia calva]|nr:ZN831 protein [Amia calva]